MTFYPKNVHFDEFLGLRVCESCFMNTLHTLTDFGFRVYRLVSNNLVALDG